jgi:hypothetical protein
VVRFPGLLTTNSPSGVFICGNRFTELPVSFHFLLLPCFCSTHHVDALDSDSQ